jgi:two-component system, OmpR family, copper resistance phosphate regulon response regulator CusR
MRNSSPRILIVDDDANITYAFKLGLERRGFLVDVFSDAADMMDKVKPDAYRVAIFDFRMPKKNGVELYREFRKLNSKTPVCFFTALDLAEQGLPETNPDIKTSTIIKKPVSIAHLAKILQEIIESTS